ncbi:TetR/AcrR family transcriptional regulator [Kitasatospora sp. NBC_01287]|uniref:TetR/AcrR family transcriptional regulator n=1 Tax=Kitasatospora sp. NBC_01287 TaxID=2903573 RepID=UPI00225A3BD5|nr:TetR family transcriptional regulator [Kitasatospora sp. NBC_01287]MCX4745809.1 TetR/AcrR family transcriptional regulator [Kitasatospora sp. NBC_01287]
MGVRTVDWSAFRPAAGESEPQGLRERKKRLMRQQLSDAATGMFLERGFDAVRVAEVAEACGVSEKTVYNYFPTKEALILDRWQATGAALRAGLGEPGVPPVEAALRILADELSALTSWLAAQEDHALAVTQFLRFGALSRSTPSLRAHQHELTDQLVATAAEVLAGRAGLRPEDPEPQLAATALIGLWRIQFQSLARHLGGLGGEPGERLGGESGGAGTLAPARVHAAVTAEVRRAARLIETGLGGSGLFAPGAGG